MKTFFLSLIPFALFGFSVFGVSRMIAFRPWTKTGQEEEYKEFRRILAMPMIEKTAAKRPKVECVSDYDFGLLPPFTDQSHEFVISNVGDEQLALKQGGESCTCLDAEFAAAVVAPGESKVIPVTWNTDKQGKFAQYVKIITNSPETPELQLWVTGTVGTILESSAQSFGYEGVLAGETRTQNFYLYSGLWDELTIDRIECSSDSINCEQIERPADPEEDPLKFHKVGKPKGPAFKSRVDLQVSVKAPSGVSTYREMLKVYVRPPDSATETEGLEEGSPEALAAALTKQKLRADGTMLVELPVAIKTARRLSLYGSAIADGDTMFVDLGKLRTTSPSKEWMIIAKIRGDVRPSDLKVSLTGIEGVSATVEQIGSGTVPYRIKIRAEEKLRLGAYYGEYAGKLIIEAPGLPGEERHEFKVELDVLEET